MPRPQIRRTLYIGLGGTGAMALRQLKKRYLEVYAHVDLENHSLPEFVKFLVFDTDRSAQLTNESTVTAYNSRAGGNSKGKEIQVNFNPSEVIGVHADNCKEIIQAAENKDLFEGWFPLSNKELINNLTDLKKGAGQIRIFGRLAFFFNSDKIKKAISDSINAIMGVEQANSFFSPTNQEIDIYIVGSLAGGTGSGMFMDTALMCRDIVTDGPNNIEVAIRGYFVLPEVFLNARIGTAHDFPRIYPNAAGALMELDMFSEFLNQNDVELIDRGGSYELKNKIWNSESSPINEIRDSKFLSIRYSNGEQITIRKSPFNRVYLVGQSNTAGNTVNNLSDISMYLAKALFSLSGAAAGQMASNDDNAKNDPNESFNGKLPWAGGIGTSEFVYNSHEVRLHLALRAIDQSLAFTLSDEVDSVKISQLVESYLQDNQLIEQGDIQNIVLALKKNAVPITVELGPEEYSVPENKLNEKRANLRLAFTEMRNLSKGILDNAKSKASNLKGGLDPKGKVRAEIRVIEEIQSRIGGSLQELRSDVEGGELQLAELAKQRVNIQDGIAEFLSMNAIMRMLKKSELTELVNGWTEVCRNVLEIEQIQEARRLGVEIISELQSHLDGLLINEQRELRGLLAIQRDVRALITNREFNSIASENPNAFTINLHAKDMHQPMDVFGDEKWNQPEFIQNIEFLSMRAIDRGVPVENLWKEIGEQILDFIFGLGLRVIAEIKEDKLQNLLAAGIEEAKKHNLASNSELGLLFLRLFDKALPLINFTTPPYLNGKQQTLKSSLRNIFYISIPSADDNLAKALVGLLEKLKSDDELYEFRCIPAPDQLDRITIFRRLLALPIFSLSGVRTYLNKYNSDHTKDLNSGMVFHVNYNWHRAMQQIGFNLLAGSSENNDYKLKLFVWALLMGWIKWEGEYWKINTNDPKIPPTFKGARRDRLFSELFMEKNYSKEVEQFLQAKKEAVFQLKDALEACIVFNEETRIWDYSGYLQNNAINPYCASITAEAKFGAGYERVQGGPSARIQLEQEVEMLKSIAAEAKKGVF